MSSVQHTDSKTFRPYYLIFFSTLWEGFALLWSVGALLSDMPIGLWIMIALIANAIGVFLLAFSYGRKAVVSPKGLTLMGARKEWFDFTTALKPLNVFIPWEQMASVTAEKTLVRYSSLDVTTTGGETYVFSIYSWYLFGYKLIREISRYKNVKL